jgi:hypothetical protein
MTRGIEAQYAAHDETMDEINNTLDKLYDLLSDREIEFALALLCMVAVESVHGQDLDENERFNLVMSAMVEAWKDYHRDDDLTKLH